MNLNFHENHVQYVHYKADDLPRVTQYTVREISYRKHINWKKALKINDGTSAWNQEQRERPIGMLTTGMSARNVVRHFQLHESTISPLLNRFQQTGNVADRPRSDRLQCRNVQFSDESRFNVSFADDRVRT